MGIVVVKGGVGLAEVHVMQMNEPMEALAGRDGVADDQPVALLRQPRLLLAWDEVAEGWVLHVDDPQFDLDCVRARGLVRA